jgi:hypothetical protein
MEIEKNGDRIYKDREINGRKKKAVDVEIEYKKIGK